MAQKFSLSYWTRACQCSSRIKILLDRMISTSNFYLFVHFLKSRQPTQFRLETIQRDRISTCFWVKSFDQVVRDSKISVPAEILRCLPTCQAFPTNFKNLNTYKCRTFDAESYGIHITFPIKTFLGTSYKKNLKYLISNIQNFSNNNSSFQVLKRRDLNAFSNCISCCSVRCTETAKAREIWM
jgi:hypothetical protein